MAVVGTSGSGKSSLVRAGLLPDLLLRVSGRPGSDWVIVESSPGTIRSDGWPVAFDDRRAGPPMRPRSAPTRRTSSISPSRHLTPGQHLLVLVDQFEELFRLKTSEDPAEDTDEKAAFVRLLLNAGGQRAD